MTGSPEQQKSFGTVLMVLSKRTLGGTAQLALEWGLAARAVGLDVSYISLPDRSTNPDAPALAEIEEVFGTVIGLGHRGSRDSLRTLARLFLHLRRNRPTVIHGYFELAEAYARLSSFTLGIPLVGTIVSTEQSNSLTFGGRMARVLRRTAPSLWVSRWIVLGETVRKRAEVAGYPASMLTLVPPGFDSESVHQRSSVECLDWPVAQGQLAAIAVGRLVPSKHLDSIVSAIALLPPEYVLVIVGSGPCRSDLEANARNLGVRDRIHFLGDRHDVPSLLAQCQVYVTATEYEGLVGYATLEAAAVGVPIVAPMLPEIVEVLDAECAVLVDAANPKALAEAIRSAAAMDGRRVANARRAVAEHFDRRRIGEALAATYGVSLDSSP